MIRFGKYYKKNNTTLEPIEWDVLYKDNTKALLLSKYVIDTRAWDKVTMDVIIERYTKNANGSNGTGDFYVTWSCCSLRSWLNGDFLKLAFSSEERKDILLTENFTKDAKRLNRMNPFDNNAVIPGGPNTKDYVFLLSVEEVLKYFTKEETLALAGPDTAFKMKGLIPQSTPYAKNKELYFSDENDETSVMWWLRSPGGANGMAANVINGNVLYVGGEKINDETLGVRPAIWVKLDALLSEEEKREKLERERKQREQEERLRKEHQQRELQQQRRNMKRCQHCGGNFKGFFKKVCQDCGKEKDY